jgi:signal transduction histidine kinase
LKLLPERPAEARGRLQRALDHAMNATSEARSAVQGLRSPDVDNDLVRSLTKIADEVTGADHPAVHVGTSGPALPLKPIVRGEVYRVIAEALRNALRHSEAREITVAIRYDPHEFRVQVRDDGKGIDGPVIPRKPRAGHFGLEGMRERAELVGGRLALWSKVGEGTRLELSIPAAAAYAAPPRRSPISRFLAWAHTPDDGNAS